MATLLSLLVGPLWGVYLFFSADSIPARSIGVPVLIIALATVLAPLYLYRKKKNKIYILIFTILWAFWGYIFSIAMWI